MNSAQNVLDVSGKHHLPHGAPDTGRGFYFFVTTWENFLVDFGVISRFSGDSEATNESGVFF